MKQQLIMIQIRHAPKSILVLNNWFRRLGFEEILRYRPHWFLLVLMLAVFGVGRIGIGLVLILTVLGNH